MNESENDLLLLKEIIYAVDDKLNLHRDLFPSGTWFHFIKNVFVPLSTKIFTEEEKVFTTEGYPTRLYSKEDVRRMFLAIIQGEVPSAKRLRKRHLDEVTLSVVFFEMFNQNLKEDSPLPGSNESETI